MPNPAQQAQDAEEADADSNDAEASKVQGDAKVRHGGDDAHEDTLPQPARKRKFHHRTSRTATLASHAVTNAQERQASFYLAHKDVIDEYARLSQEIHDAKQAVVKLQNALSHFVKGLKHYAQT